jgi:hypothetical protein
MPFTQGGTFFSANNVNTADIIHNHRHGETGIHILHRAVVLEALYDSADSFPQPKCHPKHAQNCWMICIGGPLKTTPLSPYVGSMGRLGRASLQ